MNIVIRELKEGDIKYVLPILEKMFLDHDLEEPKLFNPYSISGNRINEYLHESLVSKNAQVFVAEDNNRIVGTIRAEIKDAPSFYKEKKIGFTDDLVVIEEYKRKGIGTKLKLRALEYFKSKGIKLAECKIYEFNKASQKLSESLGYKKTFSYYYKHL